MRLVLAVGLMVGAAACANGTKVEARTEAVLHTSIVATSNPGSLRFADRYDTSTGPDGVVDCATAASDGNSAQRTFVVASSGSRQAPVYLAIRTRGFKGPGVYRDSDVLLDSVGAQMPHRAEWFVRQPTSHVVLTLNDDASGTATLSGYRAPDGSTIAARLSWTCTTKTVLWPTES